MVMMEVRTYPSKTTHQHLFLAEDIEAYKYVIIINNGLNDCNLRKSIIEQNAILEVERIMHQQ